MQNTYKKQTRTSNNIEMDNVFLQAELAKSLLEIEKLKAKSMQLEDMVILLREAIKLAKQHRFGSSSEKNILQIDLLDEAGVELPDEVKAQVFDEVIVESYSRKKHPGRRPLPSHLPREVIIYDIDAVDKICDCGAHLVKIGEDVSEQLKYIPATLSVIQHCRLKYACKPCAENIKIAPMPTLLLPKSIATPELIAHTIVSKYVDHLPLYRQEVIWQRLQIDLARSSLCGWMLKVADICKPLVRLLREMILQYDYVGADETTLQVLKELGRSNQTKSYLWVYRGGELHHPSLVFEYHPTRSGAHARSFLDGFKGYLQSDAYSGYNWVDTDEKIISIGCMAHARRPFAEMAKISKKSGLAAEALGFFKKLYATESDARKNNLSYEERHQLRQKNAVPILEALKAWLNTNLTKVPKQHKLGQAIHYAQRHWQHLTNYLLDGRIEIDNNRVENAIRPIAIGRKNYLFAGSPSGAEAAAIFYSLIETCKANNIEPYKYFSTMLHQIRLCKTDEDYQKLLPQFIHL
jgi:transposase